jgi:two-component system, sensor histidine kinase and response regulator
MALFSRFTDYVSFIGFSSGIPEYEQKRMIIFNRLNFCAFCISIVRLIYMIFFAGNFYNYSTIGINIIPAAFFVLVAILVYYKQFTLATICEFLVVPPLLTFVNEVTHESGLDMFVVLYMLFCFFYLNRPRNVLFAFLYCCFFFMYMHFWVEKYPFFPGKDSPGFMLSLFNYLSAFFMIFLTMYSIKYNVWDYKKSIKEKNEQLLQQNAAITAQRDELGRQAAKLREKTDELMELNHVKAKLFSIISHDLRTSVYAVKNIFDALDKGYISGQEMLDMIPQASSEISNSIDLVNNLLGWARNQFHEIKVNPQTTDLVKLTEATFRLFERQAQKKNISLVNKISIYVFAYADNDMIGTVLRNLVSNAIKFTNTGGLVEVRTEPDGNFIRLIISDNGVGISETAIDQVFNNEYYTTPGTANEQGTGLGLMICRDFVKLNRGRLDVKSREGEGTSFIVTLPYNHSAVQGG